MNRDEAKLAFDDNMEAAFQYIDREFDQGLYWSEAQKIVDTKREALAEKSKAWANPYFHANSAIRAAAGNVNTSVKPALHDTEVAENTVVPQSDVVTEDEDEDTAYFRQALEKLYD